MTAFIFDKRDGKRLFIASDTLGYTHHSPPKPAGFLSKIFILPHLRSAICGVGMCGVPTLAFEVLASRMDIDDYDSAALALPAILRDVTELICDRAGIEDDPTSLVFSKVMWSGWSPKHGRPTIIGYQTHDNYEPQAPDFSGDGQVSFTPMLAPNYMPPGLAGGAPDKVLTALMIAMQRYVAENPEVIAATIGGEVQITEITENGVSTRMVHRFADYAATKAAASAVWARIQRGEDDVGLPSQKVADWGDEDDADVAFRIAGHAKPAPDAPLGSSTAGMNRQQRRAAEKLARKAGRRAA